MKKSILTVVIILAADFLTKHLIRTHLNIYEAIHIGPYLNIVHVQNTGAAFGMMSSLNRYVFVFIALVAVTAVGWALTRYPDQWFTLSLILGGALGNLWDRVARGHVTDFVDLHIGDLHWPAFNVADAALSLSMLLLLLASFRPSRPAAAGPPA